jgi:hypothetical protein
VQSNFFFFFEGKMSLQISLRLRSFLDDLLCTFSVKPLKARKIRKTKQTKPL